jgi:hypothetical protein
VTGHIAAHQADVFRREYLEGYSIDHIAQKWGVSPATVKRHASYIVGDRRLLLRTEVHIDGHRGRWEFRGGIGWTKEREQFADFVNTRTGRSRTFYTRLITTVHRKDRSKANGA